MSQLFLRIWNHPTTICNIFKKKQYCKNDAEKKSIIYKTSTEPLGMAMNNVAQFGYYRAYKFFFFLNFQTWPVTRGITGDIENDLFNAFLILAKKDYIKSNIRALLNVEIIKFNWFAI